MTLPREFFCASQERLYAQITCYTQVRRMQMVYDFDGLWLYVWLMTFSVVK